MFGTIHIIRTRSALRVDYRSVNIVYIILYCNNSVDRNYYTIVRGNQYHDNVYLALVAVT